LYLVQKRQTVLLPLAEALQQTADHVQICTVCGNYDSVQPCAICQDQNRDQRSLCVVEDVGALWAMERSGAFHGQYHVLGGLLSALDGIGPDDLRLPSLRSRIEKNGIAELILATPATIDGQTTAHYIVDYLQDMPVTLCALAHGVPIGGSLDHLDDGTITAALKARHSMGRGS
jgi:recombination protein RecR